MAQPEDFVSGGGSLDDSAVSPDNKIAIEGGKDCGGMESELVKKR